MTNNIPNETPGEKIENIFDGRDDPNRGPVDRVANALDGHDDPNRGPLDRAENAFGARRAATSPASWPSGGTEVVSAVFDSDEEARAAISALRSAGISDASLSLITQRRGTTTTSNVEGDVVDEEHSNWLRGILGGGALGAGLGIAALAIPGVGPLVAAGAIAAAAVPEALAIGAVAGAALGMGNEALKNHGVSEEDVAYYGNTLKKDGGVLVTVHPHGEASKETIQQILHAHGGHNAALPRVA
ncbi:MAG: hypothetical protein EOP50_01180 [Sphingobacteriales bacterium]|nr:MAG: hypothetical protein EOP50_01180 [Sphingobacteriales bacterium]